MFLVELLASNYWHGLQSKALRTRTLSVWRLDSDKMPTAKCMLWCKARSTKQLILLSIRVTFVTEIYSKVSRLIVVTANSRLLNDYQSWNLSTDLCYKSHMTVLSSNCRLLLPVTCSVISFNSHRYISTFIIIIIIIIAWHEDEMNDKYNDK